MKKSSSSDRSHSEALLAFIDRSPTPFHAVAELQRILSDRGFTGLGEDDAWDLKKGGRYFVARNGSSLCAFVVGSGPVETAGFRIIGAHTDSPNLRIKPNACYEKSGYVQLGVEVYGGALLGTWTDRDLSLAGRVVLKGKKEAPVERLLKVERPLLRIPQLAIHLNRKVNDEGLVLNRQLHLPPILNMAGGDPEQALNALIAAELGCKPDAILSHELSLYDVQPSAFAGPDGEFLVAPRLDNLASCHAAAEALADAPVRAPQTRVLALFDNEEVGSDTAQGGGSPFLRDVLERLTFGAGVPREVFMRAVARSLFISADMAHAVHPNYSDVHEARHLPLLNRGPVIKSNAGQRYATDAASSARFELLCERAGVPVQKFVMRSDLQCGSTIGPITAASLGIRTVDVGNPMLSMHSIREMAGAHDHAPLIRVFQEFFQSDRD